jgi:hypothetical protein
MDPPQAAGVTANWRGVLPDLLPPPPTSRLSVGLVPHVAVDENHGTSLNPGPTSRAEEAREGMFGVCGPWKTNVNPPPPT